MMLPPKGNTFYNISAVLIERYLLNKGWQRDLGFMNKRLMVFNSDKVINQIAISSSEKYDDFFIVLYDVLKTISSIENVNVETIIKEVLTVCFDRLEFRIISSFSTDGKLPLDYASSFIEGLKDLVLYSACAEEMQNQYIFVLQKQQEIL